MNSRVKTRPKRRTVLKPPRKEKIRVGKKSQRNRRSSGFDYTTGHIRGMVGL